MVTGDSDYNKTEFEMALRAVCPCTQIIFVPISPGSECDIKNIGYWQRRWIEVHLLRPLTEENTQMSCIRHFFFQCHEQYFLLKMAKFFVSSSQGGVQCHSRAPSSFGHVQIALNVEQWIHTEAKSHVFSMMNALNTVWQLADTNNLWDTWNSEHFKQSS